MNNRTNVLGKITLALNHVAGMIGLVILPIWIGVLVQYYKYDAQQAGVLASLFLAAAVITSIVFASLYDRVSKRLMTTIGFLITAATFLIASQSQTFSLMALMHFLGGIGAGWGLSLTHGTIGRSENPHRLFSLAQLALGIAAILFFAIVPNLISKNGGATLFLFLTILMLTAACAAAVAFPRYDQKRILADSSASERIPRIVWLLVIGVIILALNQALTSAYFERYGVSLGFDQRHITTVLVIAGIVVLTPAIFAALLQNRIRVKTVAIAGSIAQGLFALILFSTNNFWVYAVFGVIGGFVMIFTHIFLFGYLAALDPSGRAVAATPAMVMFGSALGPIIGGTLVITAGYFGIGVVAAIFDAIAILICFSRIRESMQTNELRNLESEKNAVKPDTAN
ncbi:MAG: MFS transporter [Candidatus Saccharibacteria bacterium]